ncbi:fimbrial protein [Pseudomonas akapageensis]|uniref:fimbrial protein n=1 Tax=Pseudomonas akapageensis TaxID=2609961 RepID=UPI00140B211A|nr:fimbrial protein [Pseudomonas akapageensis]
MKKTLISLALGLASTSAFAYDGSINFYGQVKGGTCPIEIIDPVSGSPLSRIQLGNVTPAQFPSVGSEAAARPFSMRITPGASCTVAAGESATVAFTPLYGGAGTGGTLYGLKPGGATGLALAIKDRTGALVDNGADSTAYPLSETDPTDMLFTALYKSTAATIGAGVAETDISFLVSVN